MQKELEVASLNPIDEAMPFVVECDASEATISATLNQYWSNLVAVMDWGGANSRFLGLVSVWAARSFDQTALRPSVIKRIRQIDVKYITHITSFGVTA